MDAAALEELFDDANGDLALGSLEEAAGKYKPCTSAAPDYLEAWHDLTFDNAYINNCGVLSNPC